MKLHRYLFFFFFGVEISDAWYVINVLVLHGLMQGIHSCSPTISLWLNEITSRCEVYFHYLGAYAAK